MKVPGVLVREREQSRISAMKKWAWDHWMFRVQEQKRKDAPGLTPKGYPS